MAKKRGIFFYGSIAFGTLSTILGTSEISRAAMPPQMYLDALKAANQKVVREKQAQSSAGALSASALIRLFGRYYRIGDRWQVASWRLESSMSRKTAEPGQLEGKLHSGGVFQYEVTDLIPGTRPQVVLKITQIERDGIKVVDPRVDHMELTWDLSNNSRFQLSKKALYFSGRRETTHLSPDGIKAGVSAVEFYPLDIPDFFTADHAENRPFPTLPAEVQDFAKKVGFHPDSSRSQFFEEDDFFGRPLDVIWQHGDPWPAYLQSPQGISILIQKETG